MGNASTAKIEALCVDVQGQDLLEVVYEALSSLYFENITINDKFAVAARQLTELEQYGNDRWEIKFEARLTWQRTAPVRFAISVTERRYPQMRKECEDKCREIGEALLRFAGAAAGNGQRRSTAHGSSFFAEEGELAQKGYFDQADSARFIVGRFGARRRVLSIPEKDTHAHVLVCGPTGSGKSRAVFIPNLIRRLETNMLVTEAVAGERNPPTLYSNTAGWRHTAGHKVFYFNPADPSSTRINPLDSIMPKRDEMNRQNPERLNFYDSAAYVANVIMRNTKEESPLGRQSLGAE